MATAVKLSAAERLERIAIEVHRAAFDFMEPATSHREVDRRTALVEDLSAELRAVVRG